MLTQEMVAELPQCPGVYFFRGKSGEILYIGKAKSLRKRVRSYLYNRQRKRGRKMEQLVRRATRVDYEICKSELEALLLESRLIKKHQPRYNTSLKTVHRSPYIKISIDDDFPRVEVAFKEECNGAMYVGPFFSIRRTREVVEALHRIFPLRTCEGAIHPNPNFRPCFSFHLRRCDAPCAARIHRADYRKLVDDVIRLLNGEYRAVVEDLRNERDRASEALRFERAGALQKRIEQIENVFVYLDVHRR